ncbi:MAG TPA: hypothetical protein VHE34_24705 [Puia sp.]|uniref:hypothetical protein n=1 Tax=Puia sp. TaxID=2045100 RepID=UPI002B7DBE3D|nr:hypothetical protein [Puia sp.]HVU98457.1 hypothetical protein [Puia sp.]
MSIARNRYLSLIIILLSISAAGFVRAHTHRDISHVKTAHFAHKYKDAVIAHRFHQNHFKRHRSNLDGCLPVQQETMIPIVTGSYAVAPVLHQHIPTPATPSLRGPPMA